MFLQSGFLIAKIEKGLIKHFVKFQHKSTNRLDSTVLNTILNFNLNCKKLEFHLGNWHLEKRFTGFKNQLD